jgi:methyltransferase, FkbM family
MVDPLKNSLKNEKNCHVINKGIWGSKCVRKLYILNKREGSSSMFEPKKESLPIYDFKQKDFNLFDVSKTEMVECDTLSSSLEGINIKNLDYLKIDTQGAELEVLKGLKIIDLKFINRASNISMYKNIPSGTDVTNLLNNLGYMVGDWRKIGSHVTRTPMELI